MRNRFFCDILRNTGDAEKKYRKCLILICSYMIGTGNTESLLYTELILWAEKNKKSGVDGIEKTG